MRLPRHLDPVEARVLGALLEKQQTTPDYYPLTVKALLAACNQRSNREPVMTLEESDVRQALDRLHAEVLVWPVQGARSERWRHSLDRRWELDGPARAVMTLLLLRGAQTPGELRGRSDRLHQFASTHAVEEALELLAAGDEPLVVQLTRRPGQKEARWTHLVCGAPVEAPAAMTEETPAAAASLADRVQELESTVTRLQEEIAALRRGQG